MVQDRIFHRTLVSPRRALHRFSVARAGLIAIVMACVSASVHAGQPLILDTQRGISDGQPGVVLQNAPLSREPMVQAAQPAGLVPDSSQPYVVAPYVEVQQGGGRPNPPPRPPRPPHRPTPPLPQPLPSGQ
ncbi:hypothetical protein LMG27952_04521 [Paraburkholderia hiiakae]|uniref:Uncharacterized protein n=1 Tax=Paraburkholderia hiiakae TaxID=1081782 RepID=A0ABM8NWV1_9BURK|nr:hypothetical protein [Paraburkholderia hiiakae]CAD6547109.1 hypothetical protein LMG27952_04521 [Paraburkholderia hiiakae]